MIILFPHPPEENNARFDRYSCCNLAISFNSNLLFVMLIKPSTLQQHTNPGTISTLIQTVAGRQKFSGYFKIYLVKLSGIFVGRPGTVLKFT